MSIDWYFDEINQVGTDYSDINIASNYEKRHSGFRNFQKESDNIVKDLGINKGMTILDLGCGTGNITIKIAEHCKKVIGVDISPAMLELFDRNAKQCNIMNYETHCAGLLSYKHKFNPVDIVISKLALHHLPDFWKSIALLNIASILKPGGKFYLFDVVYCFKPEFHKTHIDQWLKEMHRKSEISSDESFETHIKCEFSTFDWILEKLIRDTGFTIEQKKEEGPICTSYICRKDKTNVI